MVKKQLCCSQGMCVCVSNSRNRRCQLASLAPSDWLRQRAVRNKENISELCAEPASHSPASHCVIM